MKKWHQEIVARKSGIEMAIAIVRDQYDNAEHRYPKTGGQHDAVKVALAVTFKKLVDEMRLIKDSEDWLAKNC